MRSLNSLVAAMLAMLLAACSLTDIVGDPATSASASANPDAVKTEAGALELYHGAVGVQARGLASVTLYAGAITDELHSIKAGFTLVDARALPTGGAELPYTTLGKVRANARQARGVLAQYAPLAPQALTGHLYAIEAMADVELAELYCSGIPLSTVDYGHDPVLRSGSTSEQVYRAAVALFDSAAALSGDSAQFLNFAKVGKGRALLGLGLLDSAAAAVADVPTEFRYTAEYFYVAGQTATSNPFHRPSPTAIYDLNGVSVVSGEGGNGLPFVTSGDWRTDTAAVNIVQPVPAEGFRVRATNKYDASGSTPIVLASGVEARLIEAEARRAAGDPSWLTILNTLRADCTPTSPCSPVLTAVPGSAPALAPLTDPGPDSARISLVFRERAAWLYLTGHRHGDLRRLVRQYGRAPETVFPTGVYFTPINPALGTYGTDVVLSPPASEQQLNPSYAGCINHEA